MCVCVRARARRRHAPPPLQGLAIGIVGDSGVRAVGQTERLFVPMILILIFAEALALYGFIVSLILSQKGTFTCP